MFPPTKTSEEPKPDVPMIERFQAGSADSEALDSPAPV